MTTKPGTTLKSLAPIPSAITARLAQLWITTAEELVSAGDQVGGIQSLSSYLGVPKDQSKQLVAAARKVLPEGETYGDEDIDLVLGATLIDNVVGADQETLAYSDLPTSVDLRDRLAPVRNQKYRGTCVAHAVVTIREFLAHDTDANIDLSEQFLYWACKQRDNYAGEGTFIGVAMSVLTDMGVCLEKVWPYNPRPIKNNEGEGPPPRSAVDDATAYRAKTTIELNGRWVESLKKNLAAGNPIAFSVPVFASLQRPYTYRVGDVRLPLPGERNLGGHAMCMVGYIDDPDIPGGGCFIVRNSWGEQFAQYGEVAPGYCRIPYEYIRKYGNEAYTAYLD